MKPQKPALAVLSLLAAASLLTPGLAQVVFDHSEVYAGTYVTLGAGAKVYDTVASGTATTKGAGAVATDKTPVIGAQGLLAIEQSNLNGSTLPYTPYILGNTATSTSFAPGVHHVKGLRTYTAGIHLS